MPLRSLFFKANLKFWELYTYYCSGLKIHGFIEEKTLENSNKISITSQNFQWYLRFFKKISRKKPIENFKFCKPPVIERLLTDKSAQSMK